ncbi:phosphonate metabolism protein/1,5-bisphosphokinase (PRPP-forming) PhnN [Acidocella sp.]|uniref:phosphonate metabolism protein/1,5-bisphosphokinase (PRPP-forming) PhnN n=1 Tax=Acidocella sp. TaxID=50710 RepID=UPI003D068BC8
MRQGLLVLVAGPSGAGKDTVLDHARAHLAGREDMVFARRVVTRPPGPGEAHECVSEGEFTRRCFALSWSAHGLRYGIAQEIETDLAQGRTVIANVSRAVIGEARARYRCKVIEITAPANILAKRLAARGRESAADIAARLARQAPPMAADAVIVNDGAPEAAGALFLSLLG